MKILLTSLRAVIDIQNDRPATSYDPQILMRAPEVNFREATSADSIRSEAEGFSDVNSTNVGVTAKSNFIVNKMGPKFLSTVLRLLDHKFLFYD